MKQQLIREDSKMVTHCEDFELISDQNYYLTFYCSHHNRTPQVNAQWFSGWLSWNQINILFFNALAFVCREKEREEMRLLILMCE